MRYRTSLSLSLSYLQQVVPARLVKDVVPAEDGTNHLLGLLHHSLCQHGPTQPSLQDVLQPEEHGVWEPAREHVHTAGDTYLLPGNTYILQATRTLCQGTHILQRTLTYCRAHIHTGREHVYILVLTRTRHRYLPGLATGTALTATWLLTCRPWTRSRRRGWWCRAGRPCGGPTGRQESHVTVYRSTVRQEVSPLPFTDNSSWYRWSG